MIGLVVCGLAFGLVLGLVLGHSFYGHLTGLAEGMVAGLAIGFVLGLEGMPGDLARAADFETVLARDRQVATLLMLAGAFAALAGGLAIGFSDSVRHGARGWAS